MNDEAQIGQIGQIGWMIRERAGTPVHWAFLRARGRIWFATAPEGFAPADSPVVRLVRGVHEAEPEQARAIARARVWTDTLPGASCRGIVRVAAKRMSGGIAARDARIPVKEELLEVPAVPLSGFHRSSEPQPTQDAAFHIEHARRIAAAVRREAGALHELARPVGAVLVSAEGRCLAWAENTNSRNRTLHAEANLLRGWGAPLPPGARIYVSLKPCRMCAGLIWDSCADPANPGVTYAEDDPGPAAQGTVLEIGSHEHRLAVNARSF